ncbi:MAG: RNA polymerase sporulation sigma factor SigK [Clostridia bacterium]|nr:RNA polymerase sporulation sigma factor SigK [Clostridia bacterium]
MLASILSAFSQFFHLILGIGTPQSFPPPLPSDVEKEYFIRLESGDAEARKQLILHNLRLVSHIVRKYYATSKNQEDLISIGTIGLIKAVDTFKVSAGARFATYAARCIQNEILMHFRSQKKLASEISLNDTIDVDRDGNPLTYIDVISCDDSLSADVERSISSDKARKYVETVLTPRERKIVTLRYGLGGKPPLTQREIASALGISRSYVSRLEKSALEKLRAAMG